MTKFHLFSQDSVRLGNRTYRIWGNIELPKYFIKLHETAPTGGVRKSY